MALFRVYVGGERLFDLFTDPHWPLWYLAALLCWRLVTPVFRSMWGGVGVAVVLSATAGLWAGHTLDLARVIGLLPFFVLGLKATRSVRRPGGHRSRRSAHPGGPARRRCVATFAFLALVPRADGWFSRWAPPPSSSTCSTGSP